MWKLFLLVVFYPTFSLAKIPKYTIQLEYGSDVSKSQGITLYLEKEMSLDLILAGQYHYNEYTDEGITLPSESYQISAFIFPYGRYNINTSYKFWGSKEYFFVDTFLFEISTNVTKNLAIGYETEAGSLTLMKPIAEGKLATDNYNAHGSKAFYTRGNYYFEIGGIDYYYPRTYESLSGELASLLFSPQAISDFARVIDYSFYALISKRIKKYVPSFQIKHTKSQVDQTLSNDIIVSLTYDYSKYTALTSSFSSSEAEDKYDGEYYQYSYFTLGITQRF